MDANNLLDVLGMGADRLGRIEAIALVVIVAALVDFGIRQALSRLARKAQATENFWDDVILGSVRGPVSLLIWVIGASLAFSIAQIDTPDAVAKYVHSARDLGVIVAAAWFFQRWVGEVANNLKERPTLGEMELDVATIHAGRKVASLAIWVISVVTGLETLGFDLSAILTAGGIGGVALGFASRDVVANFFGGLMIYVKQPFRVGDWIRSPDRNIEGTVEEIAWYQTRIRTFDKRPLYVPNAIFPGIAVENPSRMLHRRIHETIGVRYDDFSKIRPIVDEVRTMLESHPDIQSEGQTLMVNFNAYSASSLDFFLYTFTKTTDWATYHGVKQDVLLRVGEIIEKHGAQIAFPTQTLHVPDGVQVMAAAKGGS